MTNKKLNRIGTITAAVTFAVATFILWAYYVGLEGDFEMYGFFFIPIAFVGNLSVLIYIILMAKKRGVHGPFRSIYLMLFNIPVAIFYIQFAFLLMGYYRVTIINDTSSKITKIELTGCDSQSIEMLAPGKKETVWMGINGDCSINISYLDQSKNTHEGRVAGYLCDGMGGKADYRLSGAEKLSVWIGPQGRKGRKAQ